MTVYTHTHFEGGDTELIGEVAASMPSGVESLPVLTLIHTVIEHKDYIQLY